MPRSSRAYQYEEDRDESGYMNDNRSRYRGSSRYGGEEERYNRRRGQIARSERAARVPHDRESHAEDVGHGGWFGDPEGHSEAAHRGWENPEHRPSGWFGDPEGHSEAAHRGWENPEHRPSGWFGDPEGHSRAARKGWGENPDEYSYSGSSRSRRSQSGRYEGGEYTSSRRRSSY